MREPIVITSSPVSRSERGLFAEGPIRRMIEGLTRTGTGADYFRALGRELMGTLGLEYAFVAEVINDHYARAQSRPHRDRRGASSAGR